MRGLVCLDMDRVLVDHLSTWQFVYDCLGINNDESFNLYNQGLLDEWDWIKLDIALIKDSWREQHGTEITDSDLRACMEGMPMMKNYQHLIQSLLDDGHHVAIVSGGYNRPPVIFHAFSQVKRSGNGVGEESIVTHQLNLPMDTTHVCTSLPTVGQQDQVKPMAHCSFRTTAVTKFKWMEKAPWPECYVAVWMLILRMSLQLAIQQEILGCLKRQHMPFVSIHGMNVLSLMQTK